MPKPPDLPAPLEWWEGFDDPNFTPVPDGFFDRLLAILTDVEVRVLLYLIRRTYGFKKGSDDVSLTQIVKGIKTKDGRQLDNGAGVSRDGAITAVQRLEARGIIVVTRRNTSERGHEANTYRVRKLGQPWSPATTRLVAPNDQGESAPPTSLVAPADSQETVVQETVNKNGSAPVSGLIWQTAADHALELRLSNPLGVPGRACDLWRASGLPERAFVERMLVGHRQAKKARLGERDRAYWAAVEHG